MESVEASGRSIEDAILQALARLGRNRDEVEISVLQEPSRGVRGMGVREARVQVFVKPGRAPRLTPGVVTPAMADAVLGDDDELVTAPGAMPGDENAPLLDDEAEEGVPDVTGPYVDQADDDYEYEEYSEEEAAEIERITTAALRDLLPADATIEELAVAALRVILGHMGVRADVEVAEALNEDDPLVLNIRSDDADVLSLLIGRRGDTLSALQLLVSLIVSKQSGTRERIIIDAESYRERREQNLRLMAERVAGQVRRSGNPVVLEAMPPNERRIVHMALAEEADISTESTGEGDQRRVVISLARPQRAPNL